MKKKSVLQILAVVLVLSLMFGCGAGSSTPASSPAANSTGSNAPAEAKWPDGPVTLSVTAAAGGGTDILARTLLESMGTYGTFAVENKTDGNGAVAFESVSREDPNDINELLFFNVGLLTNYITGLTSVNPVKDLTPVFAMDQDGVYYLVVPKDSPFNTVEDVVKYCKEHPGELQFGANMGDAVHIFSGCMQQILGVEWNWVSTGADGDRIGLIMGNNLDITVLNQSTTWNYYQSDDIKVLCSLQGRSTLADPKLSSVPTLEEAGYSNVPVKMTIYVWAPNGAPDAVYEEMNRILTEASSTDAFINAYKERGNLYYSIGDFQTVKTTIAQNLEDMTTVCKDLGLAAEGR